MRPLAWLAQKAITWLTSERPGHLLLDSLADHAAFTKAVRPADVLLMEGMTRVGGLIKTISQSTWSHAALYVGDLTDLPTDVQAELLTRVETLPTGPQVLEVLLGQGAVLKPLSDYAHTHLRLCRPTGLLAHDQAAVVAYAVQRVGYDYDLRQLIDLARFALPWPIVPHRFRSTLFAKRAGPHTRTVCSTLIAEAFQSVRFPILPVIKSGPTGPRWYGRDSRLSMPKDFDLSPFFSIVKVLPEGYVDYRTLQWENDDTTVLAAEAWEHGPYG